MRAPKSLIILVSLAMLLALSVVALGAYTRLTDAGLGCPDWPGCYGHMLLPSQASALTTAQQSYPDIPIESTKAWTEMAHRYLAGSLGLLLIGITAVVLKHRRQWKLGLPWKVPFLLLGLVVFQALLGMWTVTLKLLPVVVMAHLLGGISIFSLLCFYRMQLTGKHVALSGFSQRLLWLTCAVVFLQIALGGWVSANYAGISCVGFPTCNGSWWPALHLAQGFNLFAPVGESYQGGLMAHELRATIQFIHRLGALTTFVIVGLLVLQLWRCSKDLFLRSLLWLLVTILFLQLSLGIANVIYILPLPVAVGHNAVAALLMACVFSIVALTFYRRPHAS